ncbi:MAG: hypothetical protein ACK58Q_08115 [Chitinophagales bacterium]
MKKLTSIFLACIFLILSCSKEDTNSSSTSTNTNPTGCNYFPYVAGSKYIFKKTKGTTITYDTLIAIKDTTIDGTKFLKCTEAGQPTFLACNYKGYMTQISDFSFLTMSCTLIGKNIKIGGSKGDMWIDSSSAPAGVSLSVARDMEIKELNISTTANGVSYNDVIKVEAQTYTYLGGFINIVFIANYYYSKKSGFIKEERYDGF